MNIQQKNRSLPKKKSFDDVTYVVCITCLGADTGKRTAGLLNTGGGGRYTGAGDLNINLGILLIYIIKTKK
jgi:hypothetical protein